MCRDDLSQKCPVNLELQQRLKNANIDGDGNRALRYRFAYACANRVRYQLEDARAIALLDVLQAYVEGRSDDDARSAAAEEAAALANHHRGSQSIDGTGHSAVSATYAVAAALAGKVQDAAEYAAYSAVYGYGGYAVSDPDAFAPEYAWQANALESLMATQTTEH